jgi:hypothetical protein
MKDQKNRGFINGDDIAFVEWFRRKKQVIAKNIIFLQITIDDFLAIFQKSSDLKLSLCDDT